MRICILTQPLCTNYGGLLQTYALQVVLKRMGHEVWTENRKENSLSLISKFKLFIKRILAPIMGIYYGTDEQNKVISQYTELFIRNYITITDPVTSNTKEVLRRYAFDAYIVGSDQVWRPCYSYYLPNYFLDFTMGDKVKRIAYAASFGTSEWEFTAEQTEQCAALAKSFDAISIREDSGVELCSKYLGVNAVCLLDPTLLLRKEDYVYLVEKEQVTAFDSKLMTYVLDQSEEKQRIIQELSYKLGLTPIVVMPKFAFEKTGPKKISNCIFPPVTKWLRGFMDAEYVVTDSFHGTVFSIIFNKPFIVIANKERGLGRFTSLLRMLGLESRLVYTFDDITDQLIYTSIDYTQVNRILRRERDRALEFLKASLR